MALQEFVGAASLEVDGKEVEVSSINVKEVSLFKSPFSGAFLMPKTSELPSDFCLNCRQIASEFKKSGAAPHFQKA